MIRKIFFFVLSVAVLFSCKNNPKNQHDNIYKFKDYIYETTSGVVSVQEPVKIVLAKDVENYSVNTEIPGEIITISPDIKGKFVLKDSRSIVFLPEENMQPDTEYTVQVNLKKLYKNIPTEYKKYRFQFKTITPNFVVNTGELQSYSKQWQYLKGYIKSADVLDIKACQSILSATQNGKPLSVKCQEITPTHFDFTIDSIQRAIDDSHIQVSWNGDAVGIKDNKGSNKILIPGQNSFVITRVHVVQNPHQCLVVNFSDPLKKRQNLSGLVHIEHAGKLRFSIMGNVLKIYPENNLSGNVQTELFNGIKSTDGYTLKNPYSEMVSFAQLKPQVSALKTGVILPGSKHLNFNFKAVNLKGVTVRVIKIFEDNVLQFLQRNNLNSSNPFAIRQVGRRIAKKHIELLSDEEVQKGLGNKWKAYAIDLSKLIKSDPGALYRVEISFTKDDAVYPCESGTNNDESNYEADTYDDEYYEDDFTEYNTQASGDEDEREEQYWDNLIYSYKRYTYNWKQKENPCHPAYYNEDRILTSNILASNIGVIAKKSENQSYYFTVTDILSTKPISGAKVQLYNYQQQEIASFSTNKEGMAQYKADNNAYFAIVSRGADKTYLRLDDGNSLSFSKFNVSGKKLQKGLKGYLYGERGVWRPGDTLHLTFVLNDKANPIPKGHPIKFELRDARGQLVNKQLSTHSQTRFHRFIVPTDSEAPTGTWMAKVSVGGARFTQPLKIATVKPNRLKIKIDFGADEIIKAKDGINGQLLVQWLHGAPAKNIKAEVNMKLYGTTTSFEDYPNYVFQDPTRNFETEEITIFDGKVNKEGKASIRKAFPATQSAPGMLKASFLTRAFEPGGDFSMDVFSKKVSPYISYVGLQSPKPRAYGSFFTDDDTTFDLITLSDQGKPIKRNGLQLKVYKINWRWWWNSSYDNLASYVSSEYHEKVYDKTINTNAKGKASFTLNIPEDRGGRYLIRIYDPKSGHATGRTAYFYRDWWHAPKGSDNQSANMLLFETDKDTYNVGDTAHLSFPSGADGRALISIENGSEVVEQRWIKTQKGETHVSLPITASMAPNVFINISLLQPHAYTANDLPIRLYGVVPILVEDPATRLAPQISMPDVLKPETDFRVTVSEKTGKPMTYTLAVVDEGLLDLTRFKTPSIWEEFNKKQALGVTTWDVFDDIIGAYGGSIDQVFAIGGDEEAVAKKGKKANRFKPVVMYLGPFRLPKGKTQTHTLHMPNYVGSVRTMLIAGDNAKNAYGSTDKTTPVRKPLMVLASLPRKLSPGEKLSLPVSVFAMENRVKDVRVQVKTGKSIQVKGNSVQQLHFDQPDEKMLYFNLDISQAKGMSTVEVIASGNGEKARYKVDIDVFNPNPVTRKFVEASLPGNSSESIAFDTFGVSGSNTAKIELSTLPPMDFTRRMQYLIQYPHGCIEQTTSSVFPQLYLPDIFDLTATHRQEIQENIQKGITRIGKFQTSDGGMSYWMGEHESTDWGTSYAGHFMIEAEKKGFTLPLSFMSNWLRYQQRAARSWRADYRSYNTDLAQAYRLYTLALAGHPELAAMNRLREQKVLSNDAKWRLAATYALAGQKEAARKIVHTANIDFQPKKYDFYTYGNTDRNRAMAMETLLLLDDKQYVDLAQTIARTLSSGTWLSTQTTAVSLLAMAKMLEKGGGKDLNVSYVINGTNDRVKTTKSVAQRSLDIHKGTNVVQLTNKGNNQVFVRILNSGKLPLGSEIATQKNLKIDLIYQDKDGHKIAVDNLRQGTDFTAQITVRNTSGNYVDNIALTALFPGGWEIVNTGFTQYGSTNNPADFTDIRDDRVNFYFSLGRKKAKTFKVQLNAAYLGTYYRFGAQAEAMYNHEYIARTQGSWVHVVR